MLGKDDDDAQWLAPTVVVMLCYAVLCRCLLCKTERDERGYKKSKRSNAAIKRQKMLHQIYPIRS